MLRRQDRTNKITCGDNWKQGVTDKGRLIDRDLCTSMEIAEAINSLNWKHWQSINQEDDMENLKVELTDIWLFTLSGLLAHYKGDDLIQYIYFSLQEENNDDLLSLLKELSRLSNNQIFALQQDTHKFLKTFATILQVVGMDFDELFNRFKVKSVLHHFRQNHGYKQGNYEKIWFGEEDNVVALSIINKNPKCELYKELEKVYKKVIENKKQ